MEKAYQIALVLYEGCLGEEVEDIYREEILLETPQNQVAVAAFDALFQILTKADTQ